MSKFAFTLVAVSALSAAPRTAHAADFGSEGTVVPSGGISLSHTLLPNGAGSFTYLSASPEVSYFVLPNWAIGGGLSFSLGAGPGYTTYGYGARATTGYYLALGKTYGLFPTIGASWNRAEFASGLAGVAIGVLGAGYSSHSISLDASLPLLFQHDSFFIGFGPHVFKNTTSGASYNLALSTMIGGWF